LPNLKIGPIQNLLEFKFAPIQNLFQFKIFPNLKFARIRKIFLKLKRKNRRSRKQKKKLTKNLPNQKKEPKKKRKSEKRTNGPWPARSPARAGINPPRSWGAPIHRF
jgi:hypothetical protein